MTRTVFENGSALASQTCSSRRSALCTSWGWRRNQRRSANSFAVSSTVLAVVAHLVAGGVQLEAGPGEHGRGGWRLAPS